MASDFQAIGSALNTKLGQGTVSAYYALADQGATLPYVIFQRLSAVDDYTFNTHEVDANYIVKVVSNKQWPGEAQTLYGSVHNLIQDAALSVTGYTSLRCRRQSTIEYREPDGFWNVGGIYRIEIIQ